MNAMTKREQEEVLTGRIRAIQGAYAEADRALMNWGEWSRDVSGMGPVETEHPHTFDQYTGDTKGYIEDSLGVPVAIPVATARSSEQRYDQKAAELLNDRMHGPGGLPQHVRIALNVAYVVQGLHESQYLREYRWIARKTSLDSANCSTWDQFCERLETALRFVSRFA